MQQDAGSVGRLAPVERNGASQAIFCHRGGPIGGVRAMQAAAARLSAISANPQGKGRPGRARAAGRSPVLVACAVETAGAKLDVRRGSWRGTGAQTTAQTRRRLHENPTRLQDQSTRPGGGHAQARLQNSEAAEWARERGKRAPRRDRRPGQQGQSGRQSTPPPRRKTTRPAAGRMRLHSRRLLRAPCAHAAMSPSPGRHERGCQTPGCSPPAGDGALNTTDRAEQASSRPSAPSARRMRAWFPVRDGPWQRAR
ncbi:uncharacterized protein BDZ99DRAFT_549196 [Mytilinidion resinicola]|uniref:Uncharacterized protein n=1 Tax=Mytilinidion resinicola TaxID=574789 RepID=A0A6A6Z3S5_9PEZI|nr:uncharacterized protein BDZ99DRAFT_549196 [Mytilinidion resinicola]KAF2814934.1 hypothetical protein BDZ99DRAFT_549196 [Mytilinidion resinicola]